jgi:hypothetical protein
MKKHRVSLIFGICAILMWAAEAATPPTATVTWTKPSLYTDGTAIGTAAVTYQLYVGATGAEVAYKTPVTSPPYVLVPTPTPGTAFCVQVTATVAGVESDRTQEVCSMIPKVTTPAAPTALKVVVQ